MVVERDGQVRVVVCSRGSRAMVPFVPDATGIGSCFRCRHPVILVGMETTWVIAGTVDSICQDCAGELARTMGMFQPQDRVRVEDL